MSSSEYILEVEDLCVEVEGKALLRDLNLVVPAGEIHALLGPNGSGKTSLMMVIMGFSRYQVTGGQIRFGGQDITELDITERARLGIGIARQRPPTIPGVKLCEILDYIVEDRPERAELVAEMARVARLEGFLDRGINEGLSGGEIRRAELLQLVALGPTFSMMDEPDSGVDPESLQLVGELINRVFASDSCQPARRRAGLIITHNGNILNHIHVDKAHVMLNEQIGCSGNPRIVMDTISQHGYEECTRCMWRGR